MVMNGVWEPDYDGAQYRQGLDLSRKIRKLGTALGQAPRRPLQLATISGGSGGLGGLELGRTSA